MKVKHFEENNVIGNRGQKYPTEKNEFMGIHNGQER